MGDVAGSQLQGLRMKPAAAMASLTHERGRNFRHITGTHIAPGSQLARARSFLFAKRVKRVLRLQKRKVRKCRLHGRNRRKLLQ